MSNPRLKSHTISFLMVVTATGPTVTISRWVDFLVLFSYSTSPRRRPARSDRRSVKKKQRTTENIGETRRGLRLCFTSFTELYILKLNVRISQVSSGLKITAGHRTMSGQEDYLSGQNLGLTVILTGTYAASK